MSLAMSFGGINDVNSKNVNNLVKTLAVYNAAAHSNH
jgi:hypothetical protein